MKKIISVLTVAAACMAYACNKSKQMEPSTSTSAAPHQPSAPMAFTTSGLSGPGPKAHLLHMQMAGSGAGWCAGFPANCVSIEPDIVVHALKAAIDDAANSNSASTVAATFSSSAFSSFDSDYLGTDATSKLTSGSYYLQKVNDTGSKASWIAGTKYPVTYDNMDFGFDCYYSSK